MPSNIGEQAILDALHQLPADRWGEVLSFLGMLTKETAGASIPTAGDLLRSELVGLWAGRDDLGDPHEFARRLRRPDR
jgi:hypothetical protein